MGATFLVTPSLFPILPVTIGPPPGVTEPSWTFTATSYPGSSGPYPTINGNQPTQVTFTDGSSPTNTCKLGCPGAKCEVFCNDCGLFGCGGGGLCLGCGRPSSCVGPACPPGEMQGGGGGGGDDPPTSPDPDPRPTSSPKPSSESESASQSESSSSSESSSCSRTITVSDCEVACSVTAFATATTTNCYTTSCYSTVTGCSATGATTTSETTVSPSCPTLPPYVPWYTDTDELVPTLPGTFDCFNYTTSGTSKKPLTTTATVGTYSNSSSPLPTSFASCSHQDEDPDQGINTAYCVCSGSTLKESLNTLITPANSCAYTALPTETVSISIGATTIISSPSSTSFISCSHQD